MFNFIFEGIGDFCLFLVFFLEPLLVLLVHFFKLLLEIVLGRLDDSDFAEFDVEFYFDLVFLFDSILEV